MKEDNSTDSAERWIATLTWEDRLIARFFPRFFKRYAPEEVQRQWETLIMAKKRQRRHPERGDGSGK